MVVLRSGRRRRLPGQASGPKKVRKQQTLQRIKEQVIQLRFGGNHSEVRNTYKVIAARLGMKQATVQSIIWRYKLNGYEMSTKRQGPTPSTITGEPLKEILSKKCLYQWRLLSLPKRCAKVMERWGIYVNNMNLSKLYRQHGIQWRVP